MVHKVRANPGFLSMKPLGVSLLPPGCDASPSQGYPASRIKFGGTHLNSIQAVFTLGAWHGDRKQF